MLLPSYSQSHQQRFEEFDLWITPSIVEIKDTERFKEELKGTKQILDLIGNVFIKTPLGSPLTLSTIVKPILIEANNKKNSDAELLLLNSFSLFFLVTGKSDNNAKCQFPLYLRDHALVSKIPLVNKGKVNFVDVPRTLTSETLARAVSKLKIDRIRQENLLDTYVNFILNENAYVNALETICRSYLTMKNHSLEDDFLLPLIVFKVKGSVSASGGHEPEEILRKLMTIWGMKSGVDFNLNDVIVSRTTTGSNKNKTRAFDFVLPYNTKGWQQCLFIQSQFYAGDSGSVSHKNVDQTMTSRFETLRIYPNATFVEYIDGAGYYSSLNGDMRKILQMSHTLDFFQLRTAPIKLRRLLQSIRFCTAIEIVHSASANSFDYNKTLIELRSQGYSDFDINRAFGDAIEQSLIQVNSSTISVDAQFEKIAMEYFLLDSIFIYSKPLPHNQSPIGYLLVPGNNGIAGIQLSSLTSIISNIPSSFSKVLASSKDLLDTIGALVKKGWIIQR